MANRQVKSFSMYPETEAKLKDLSKEFGTNMSKVLKAIIDNAYNSELVREYIKEQIEKNEVWETIKKLPHLDENDKLRIMSKVKTAKKVAPERPTPPSLMENHNKELGEIIKREVDDFNQNREIYWAMRRNDMRVWLDPDTGIMYERIDKVLWVTLTNGQRIYGYRQY